MDKIIYDGLVNEVCRYSNCHPTNEKELWKVLNDINDDDRCAIDDLQVFHTLFVKKHKTAEDKENLWVMANWLGDWSIWADDKRGIRVLDVMDGHRKWLLHKALTSQQIKQVVGGWL